MLQKPTDGRSLGGHTRDGNRTYGRPALPCQGIGERRSAGHREDMTPYPLHTVDTAPDRAKQSLEGLRQAMGLIPNLAATMANSPPLLNSFVAAFGQFHGGSFTPGQRQVLLLTNAVTNGSTWAVAFHSTLALNEGVAPDDVAAIRDGAPPADPRLAALSTMTKRLIQTRGHVEAVDVSTFFDAGFGPDDLLEVITGVAISTMANYAGNVANPPVEEPFRAQTWDGLR
jgi:alkylhydroperoxidase family enzyme